jgi:NADH-quinone oxidoreductase subunit L
MTSSLNLWLIPTLPLAGAAINGIFGKKSSRTAISVVGLFFSGAAFAWALYVAFSLFRNLTPEVRWADGLTLPYQEYFAHWIRSGSFAVDFAFYVDQLSLIMLLVVTGVGFLIHIYSVGYMWDDPSYYRFFA